MVPRPARRSRRVAQCGAGTFRHGARLPAAAAATASRTAVPARAAPLARHAATGAASALASTTCISAAIPAVAPTPSPELAVAAIAAAATAGVLLRRSKRGGDGLGRGKITLRRPRRPAAAANQRRPQRRAAGLP